VIAIEDLVTLRAGLERTSGSNYGAWVNSPNWFAYALSRLRIAEPGGWMLYSTGSTHILGAALAEATGQSLLTQARRSIKDDSLGIEIPSWTRDPQGYDLGENEMALRPTAMLKMAALVRDGGRRRSLWSELGYGMGTGGFCPGRAMCWRGGGGQIVAADPRRGVAVASDPTLPARSGGYFGDLMRLLDGPSGIWPDPAM